jgi:hypothetical protein
MVAGDLHGAEVAEEGQGHEVGVEELLCDAQDGPSSGDHQIVGRQPCPRTVDSLENRTNFLDRKFLKGDYRDSVVGEYPNQLIETALKFNCLRMTVQTSSEVE